MKLEFLKTSGVGVLTCALAVGLLTVGCQPPQPGQPAQQSSAPAAGNTAATDTATTATTPNAAAPAANDEQAARNLPVTLPVLDAMFADTAFAGELKSKLGLTDEQIERLKTTAQEARGNLSEDDANGGSTANESRRALEQMRGIIGEEKTAQLARLVRERWEGGGETGGESNNTGQPAVAAAGSQPNSIPSDTRVVVNAPAYRMDVFKDGQLVRSYKVGIGYPEFPLPTGTRRANEIIFNPTWTPPDEPWVKGKVKPGEKVEAGSALNPLGPIKIPIGSPSLIHGGKQPGRLGGFASHGCVGLTNPQVQEFATVLAQLTGTEISDADVAAYEKAKTETKNVKLSRAVPVELRYETIVVEDGKLKIYRDVYERGTNTEANLRRVLEANGVSLDSLSEQERAKALDGINQMARDASGNPADPATAATSGNANGASGASGNAGGNANTGKNANQNPANKNSTAVKETRTIKGAKEVTVEIAALKGKGYPAPVDLNTGGRSRKPLNLGGTNAGSTNANGNANNAANTNRATGAANAASATRRL